MRINKTNDNLRTEYENQETHENHKISCDNYENHENHIILYENQENHDNLRITRQMKIMKILEFHVRITKIIKIL